MLARTIDPQHPNHSYFKVSHFTETTLVPVIEKLVAARPAKLSSALILQDLSAWLPPSYFCLDLSIFGRHLILDPDQLKLNLARLSCCIIVLF